MKNLFRHLVFPFHVLVYGIAFALVKYLVRAPKPLDPEATWKILTEKQPAFIRWIVENYPPSWWRRIVHARHYTQSHELGIAEHYDVSNDFYKLFLDRKYMFYTCADFHADTTTIEQAQTNKAEFIQALVDPQPGEKILELGCGWGSMMKHMYQATGDKENLYGWTISNEQVAYNQQENGFNVEFRNFITCDYNDEEFDKIYSIGAWEAVRPADHAQLMDKLYRTLKPGGRLVLHFFCFNADWRPANSTCGFIYFPGHVLSSFRFYQEEFERAGFHITAKSMHDYRPTLKAWFDRLIEKKEEAQRIVDMETYNRYVTFFPASWNYFNEGNGMLIRWVLDKPAA